MFIKEIVLCMYWLYDFVMKFIKICDWNFINFPLQLFTELQQEQGWNVERTSEGYQAIKVNHVEGYQAIKVNHAEGYQAIKVNHVVSSMVAAILSLIKVTEHAYFYQYSKV